MNITTQRTPFKQTQVAQVVEGALTNSRLNVYLRQQYEREQHFMQQLATYLGMSND